MGYFWAFIAVCVLAAAGIIIVKSKGRKQMADALAAQGFTPTQQFMGEDGLSGIAVDDVCKRIALINRAPSMSIQVVPYGDIISSEIKEDGDTIHKTQRGSQIAGAVVGGVLLGGVGAVIGGLSGSQKVVSEIKRIDLNIVVNSIAQPVHKVCFMDVKSKKDGIVYKQAFDKANQWHSRISAVIKQADNQ